MEPGAAEPRGQHAADESAAWDEAGLMAGRQTQPGRPALRAARKILRADMKQAPREDYYRERIKPGTRVGATPVRS
jgi:hypothetical protein